MIAPEPSMEPAVAIESKSYGTSRSAAVSTGAEEPPGNQHLISRPSGGPPEGREIKCWFPGGSSAPVLTAADLDVPYDFDSMATAGSMLGSGAIIVVDDSTPILEVAMKVAKFYSQIG